MLVNSSSYFDECYNDYQANWSGDHLHLGFWYEDTSSHEVALLNTVEEAIKHLGPKANDRILDLGCGTGGTCRIIAQRTGARTFGITNSTILLENARKLTKGAPRGDLIEYILGDYLNSGLSGGWFNRIIAIESACMTEKTGALIDEIFRLLAPGGRAVIVDFFLQNDISREMNSMLHDEWLVGWSMSPLKTVESYIAMIEERGFSSTSFIDRTDAVRKSCEDLAKRIGLLLPSLLPGYAMGIQSTIKVRNLTSAVKMNDFLKLNLWRYGILVFDKE